MGAVEVPRAADVETSAGCHCCHRKVASSSDSRQTAPEEPDSDCGCGSCLCHGAVVSDKVLVDIDYDVVIGVFTAHADDFVCREENGLDRFELPFPPDPLGQDMCVRLQRFLI